MDRGACWATAHRVARSWTCLSTYAQKGPQEFVTPFLGRAGYECPLSSLL